jgi:Protein of unknown function (DUF499)
MLPNIFETCLPREEILGGDLAVEMFAARLRPVVEGTAPLVYGDSVRFFENTHPTEGLKTLIAEVFGRLSGQRTGSPVIRLETSFGGGKTHDQIALWHVAKRGRALQGIERFINDVTLLPEEEVAVAAIDGKDLDPVSGVFHADTGITTYTLWGEIAYQIGGIEGYRLLRGADEQKVAPGTSVLERLTAGKPTLIMLDEIARHLRAAKAMPIAQSNLADQVVGFLFSLMDLAASSSHVVLVYTLAASSDAFADETASLRELVRASARVERVLSPSNDVDIYSIVKSRLFSRIQSEAAEKIASAYHQLYRGTSIALPEVAKDAPYAEALRDSYPFHPELFNLLIRKISAIPNFQRTRGALRLFAQVIRNLWRDPAQKISLIHIHHIPVGTDSEVTDDMTSRLDRTAMSYALGADVCNLTGRKAHAQVQDKEWLVAGKPPYSTWVARTIFLNSLTTGTSSGVRRTELNLSILAPGQEGGFVERAIERLASVAWYLDDDPITGIARFREEPSINKIIAEEAEQIHITEAKDELRRRRDGYFAHRHFRLIVSPDGPQDVDDKSDDVALCVIDFNEALINSSIDAPPDCILKIFNNTGESGKFRLYRNRLLFLLAGRVELERAIENARQYLAIKRIVDGRNRLGDLSEQQQQQIKKKSADADLGVRVSITNAYRHLFYPAKDDTKAPKGLMHHVLPAQEASEVSGKKNQQDVLLKALIDCQKIRKDDAQDFAPIYILDKVWPAGMQSMTTKSLLETFGKNLNLYILLSGELSKLRETVSRGLREGNWDLKMGSRVFVKVGTTTPPLPTTIELSERQELYRRGILQPPEPRVVELDAFMQGKSSGQGYAACARWRASGAVSVTLFVDGASVGNEFRPGDQYSTDLNGSAVAFKAVANYGDGETAEASAKVDPGLPPPPPPPPEKREQIEAEGSPTNAFTSLADLCADLKVVGISRLEIEVTEATDVRKLYTTLPLLSRYNLLLEQNLTAKATDQFLRLEYQGIPRNFQPFQSAVNTLLQNPQVQANTKLRIAITFELPAHYNCEIQQIATALGRAPADRIHLLAKVTY